MKITHLSGIILLTATILGTLTIPTINTAPTTPKAQTAPQKHETQSYDFNQYRSAWATKKKELLTEYITFVDDKQNRQGLTLTRLDEIAEEVHTLHETTINKKITPIISETLLHKVTPHNTLNKNDYQLAVEELNQSLTDETSKLNSLKKEWTTVIHEEQTRIEEETKRNEALKQAEAQKAQTPQQQNNTPTPPAPANNDNQSRLDRAIAELGLPLPTVTIGTTTCGGNTNVLGCYNYTSIEITLYAFSWINDCQLKFVLAHEYRHHYQNQTGMYTYDAEGKMNIAELEADANAFAINYGCGV